MNNTPTAPDIGINTTSQFEEYLQRKFWALLQGVEVHMPFPTHWTLDLLSEVDCITLVLVEAFQNPSEIISALYDMDLIQCSTDILGC